MGSLGGWHEVTGGYYDTPQGVFIVHKEHQGENADGI